VKAFLPRLRIVLLCKAVYSGFLLLSYRRLAT